MSDESPYQPIRITTPDGHPLTDTAGFTDAIAQVLATPSPRFTVLIAESHEQCTRWCWENHRSPRDPNVIRITNGFRDQYRLQGITDCDVVVLDPCRGYDEVMAYIRHRQLPIRKG